MKISKIKIKYLLTIALAILLATASSNTLAQEHQAKAIAEMSMEELMQVEVISVSKRPQTLQNIAAAIFVITSKDIKSSTARNIPDLLRMVPGVDVAQFDGNKWAVSIRGFNRLFANQLLVLLDGKTTYTQLFSGVYWDNVDVILEDIERIEVIRGPGAAIWGANAVNGVINIITKKSKDTLGTYATIGGGSTEPFGASLRYGEEITDSSFIRYWAKSSNFSNLNADQGIPANDSSENYRGGLRLDSKIDEAQAFTFSLSGYRENHRSTAITPQRDPNLYGYTQVSDYGAGFTAVANYSNKVSQDQSWELKTFFDRFLRKDIGLEYYANTADIELQNTNIISRDFTIVSGVGARLVSDELNNSELTNLSTDDTHQNNTLVNFFTQADYQLIPDRLNLSVGSKFEYVTYTGLEIEPTVKLGYNLDETNFIWGSFSRAARVPSRSDNNISFLDYSSRVEPNTGLPLVVNNLPNEYLDSEILNAYELGYRSALSQDFTFDLSLFINNYQNLIGTVPGQPTFMMDTYGPFLEIPVVNENSFHAESKGAEVALSWEPHSDLDFKLAYSTFDLSISADRDRPEGTSSNIQDGDSPGQNFSLLSQYKATEDVALSAWIAYVAAEPSFAIDSYWRLDLRAKYSLCSNVDLNIYGANLISEQPENRVGYLLKNSEIPRSVYGEIEVRF